MAHELPIYPADHKVGMEVPFGGSNCIKCKYLDRKTMKNCGESDWVKWNGSSLIPVDPHRYCCDFFEPRTKKSFSKVGK